MLLIEWKVLAEAKAIIAQHNKSTYTGHLNKLSIAISSKLDEGEDHGLLKVTVTSLHALRYLDKDISDWCGSRGMGL
jgi:hypothetical protein